MMTENQQELSMHKGDKHMAAAREPIGEAVSSAFNDSNVQDFDSQLIAQITENVIKQLRLTKSPVSSSAPQQTPQASQTLPLTPPETERRATAAESAPPELVREAVYESSPPRIFEERVSFPASEHSQSAKRPEPMPMPSASEEETPLERKWGLLFDGEGTATPRLGQLLRGVAVHLVEDYEPRDSIVVTPHKMVEYYKNSKLDNEVYPWHVVFDDDTTYVSRMYRDLGCQHHLVQEDVHTRPETPGLTPAGFARWMTLMLLAHPEEEFERIKNTIVTMPIDNPDDKTERFPKDISRRLFPTLADAKSRNKLRRSMRKHTGNGKIPLPEYDDSTTDDPKESYEDLRPTKTDSHDTFRPRRATGLESPEKNDISAGLDPNVGVNRTKPAQDRRHIPTVGADGTVVPDDEYLAPTKPIERERKPYSATPGGGRMYEEPAVVEVAGIRTEAFYPTKAAPITATPPQNVLKPEPVIPNGPPSPTVRHTSTFPRQSSVPPPTSADVAYTGLARSNSGASRMSLNGHTQTNTHGPPPPAMTNMSSAHQSPEIHQMQPSPTVQRSRRASTNRRRAPSGGQSYLPPADLLPGVALGTYDTRQPVYVERSGGYDGYGVHEDELGGRRQDYVPNGSSVRFQSRERRRESPSKRDYAPTRSLARDEDYYKDTARY